MPRGNILPNGLRACSPLAAGLRNGSPAVHATHVFSPAWCIKPSIFWAATLTPSGLPRLKLRPRTRWAPHGASPSKVDGNIGWEVRLWPTRLRRFAQVGALPPFCLFGGCPFEIVTSERVCLSTGDLLQVPASVLRSFPFKARSSLPGGLCRVFRACLKTLAPPSPLCSEDSLLIAWPKKRRFPGGLGGEWCGATGEDPTALYWTYIHHRGLELGRRPQNTTDLAVVRLACPTVEVSEVGGGGVSWGGWGVGSVAGV